VQPAQTADEFMAGTQVKMIRIGQQNADAQVVGEVALGEPFDGGLRAHRHEDRGFNGAMRRVKQARARAGMRAFGDQFEGDLGQIRL